MTRRRVALLTVAVVAAIGSVLCWIWARSPVDVAPITDGQPATTSVAYSGSMLTLAMLLAAVAGVCAVKLIVGARGDRT